MNNCKYTVIKITKLDSYVTVKVFKGKAHLIKGNLVAQWVGRGYT